MTTVYLHIGMPKTGSTSLQKFLFANRIQLLEEGYLYPITDTKKIGQIWDRYSHIAFTFETWKPISEQGKSISIRLDKRLSAQPSYSYYPWPPVDFFVPDYVGKWIPG